MSSIAVEAILTEPGDDGINYLNPYVSQTLNKVEQTYLTTKITSN